MQKTRLVHASIRDGLRAPFALAGAGRGLRDGSQAPVHDLSPSPEIPGKILAASVALAVAIVAWAAVNLVNGWGGFATVVPIGFRGSGEMAISVARLFAALVLILIVADALGHRLRWVASGFIVLGLGQLVFGYLEPILADTPNLNQSLYEMILVRTLAGALIVIGLMSRQPPPFSWRAAAGVFLLSGACIIGYWFLGQLDLLPQLVQIESLEQAARLRIAPMSWMTGWHWAFAAPAFGLAVAAAIAALDRNRRGEIGGWLPLAMVLLAGSELHDVLWPSAYSNSALLNTADLMRLAMAAVVVVGGTLELRRITTERAALLAAETERVQQLQELAILKAEFTSMVAHELGHPLSAIRRQTEMLSSDGLDSGLRNDALTTIIRETDALDTLVADVQATASIERDDFGAQLRQVPIKTLIQDVAVIADAYDRNRQLEITLDGFDGNERVLADRERIGQVLRNLICNAAKYSPEDTPISLCVLPANDNKVRLEVIDRGPGIDPDDLPRIFNKFERGRNGVESHASGAGIGLYLSRHIVRAHGSELTVNSRPGAGSIFAFELRNVSEISMG